MLGQRKVSASVKEWSGGTFEAVLLRTDLMSGGMDLGKAPLCKHPFCKHKALPAWCSSWSHFLPLGPAGNGAPSAVMPRQGSVRTGSLQLLSIMKWTSHSHPYCRSHCHTTNFPNYVLQTHLRVWCVIEMTENCWILGFFFILRWRSVRKEGVIPIKWKFWVEFYLFQLEQFAFCLHSSPNLNSQNKTAHRRFVAERKSLHKYII